jgi:hypothetical protein
VLQYGCGKPSSRRDVKLVLAIAYKVSLQFGDHVVERMLATVPMDAAQKLSAQHVVIASFDKGTYARC